MSRFAKKKPHQPMPKAENAMRVPMPEVNIPDGVEPAEWLSIREKSTLAFTLFQDRQYFLALNALGDMNDTEMALDPDACVTKMLCYMNLGFYRKCQDEAEMILSKQNSSMARQIVIMSLFMQGLFNQTDSYISTLDEETLSQVASIVAEIAEFRVENVMKPWMAAIGGHIDQMQAYIKNGGSPNEACRSGRLGPGSPSLLSLAAANNQHEMVKFLIEAGAETDVMNLGWTPLHIASFLGYLQVVSNILDYKPECISAKIGNVNATAVQMSIMNNDVNMTKMLLIYKADVTTDMPTVPSLGISEDIILGKQSSIVRVKALTASPVWYAAAKGHAKVLQALLEANLVKVNDQNAQEADATLLHFACGRGVAGDRCYPEAIRVLIDNGADVNALTSAGYSPLHFLARCGSPETDMAVRMLLDAKANINSLTKKNETPLVCALSSGSNVAVQELIVQGADMNATIEILKQPILSWCVLTDAPVMVRTVMDSLRRKAIKARGIDLVALESGSEVEKKKINFTMDELDMSELVNAANALSSKVELSPIHWACLKGDFISVKFLLDAGADISRECVYEGKKITPLQCSRMYAIGKQMHADKGDMKDCEELLVHELNAIKKAIALSHKTTVKSK